MYWQIGYENYIHYKVTVIYDLLLSNYFHTTACKLHTVEYVVRMHIVQLDFCIKVGV